MGPPGFGIKFSVFFQNFFCVFPDGCEHQQAGLAARQVGPAYEAFIQERAQPVENIHVQFVHLPGAAGHDFHFLEGAAGKHGQQGEQSLLLWAEELIAPVDSAPEGLLTQRDVTGPSLQELQAVAHALQQGPR